MTATVLYAIGYNVDFKKYKEC